MKHLDIPDKRKLLDQVKSIPPIPLVVSKIMELVDQNDTGADQLAALMEHDVGLSSRVLRITNSAFFGLSTKVHNLQQAVVILGFSEIKNLTLSIALQQHVQKIPAWQIMDSKVFWRHSLAVASAGKILADPVQFASINVFTLGILHELGKCALANCLPDHYKVALADTSRVAEAAEKHHCGLSQADIGAFLCNHWKFPHYISDAIAHQHNRKSDTACGSLLYRANCLAIKAGFVEVGQNKVDYAGYWPENGLPEDIPESAIVELLQAVDEVERVFFGSGI